MFDLFSFSEEREKRRRVCVSLWAYAYEMRDHSMVSDAKYDETCKAVDLSQATGNPKLDKWFKDNFDPDTGMWVRDHPEIEKLERLFNSLMRKQPQNFTEKTNYDRSTK